MEWSILFMGPVGAGKTQAVRSASDIEVVSTDVRASDATARLKPDTTVAMDVGAIHTPAGRRVRLLGAPGQDRFDFMWDILLRQAHGVVLLVHHGAPDPLADLEHHLGQLARRVRGRGLPVLVAATHGDKAPHRPVDAYARHLEHRRHEGLHPIPGVRRLDARDRGQVRESVLYLADVIRLRG